MAIPDLTDYTSYAHQVISRMVSSDILTGFPECQHFLQKHAADFHDWQIVLPLISCLAAGGTLEDGIEISSAWCMICLAAATLDDIEDKEFTPDDVVRSPEQAINLGTSLIFLSFRHLGFIKKADAIVRAGVIFSSEGFAATSGQHQDLLAMTPPTASLSVNDALEKYWQKIILKSGSIFRMGTAGGAAIGTSDETIINGLGDFGTALGVIIQLLDDSQDIVKTSDDDIQTWEISLPLLLYLLAKGEENIVFPSIRTKAEWHTCLREARVIEMLSSILLQWKARALESIQKLNLTPEKKVLEELPTLILGPITQDGPK